MKKLCTVFVAVFMSACVFAQVPQKMSYQAVIRNSNNELIVNQIVGMKISILRGSASGIEAYSETQTPITNANGLVSIEIGNGVGFDMIRWRIGTFFIKTETDPTGGTNYTITGTSQLLSVPYALQARNGFYYADSTDLGDDRNVRIGKNPWDLPLSVDGRVAITPGTMTWGAQLVLAANNLQGGKGYSINSLGGDAQEGQGKFLINGPSGGVMLIDSLGNVGFGTNDPQAKLDVVGDLWVQNINDFGNLGVAGGNLWLSVPGTQNVWQLITDARGFHVNGATVGGQYGTGTSPFAIEITAPDNSLFIKSTGNIGIGTDDPTSKLQVVGLPEYADNAAAITGGLTVGAFYRTGDILKVVH